MPDVETLGVEPVPDELRTVGRRDLSAGYVTLGAGTRASSSGTPSDGAALETTEAFGDQSAREVFRQRTGRSVSRGVVHLGIGPLLDANRDLHIDLRVGEYQPAGVVALILRLRRRHGDELPPP